MNNLTKNIRTHIAIMRDGTELNLTQDQYSTLRLAKEDRKSSDFITIKCPDTGKVEYDGELGNIKQFKEKDISYGIRKYICNYGVRHYPKEECNCYKNFGMEYRKFWDKLTERGYNFQNPSDIKENRINEILKNTSRN